MKTLNRTNIVVLCCLFALGVTNVQAQDITIELTAKVASVDDPCGLLNGGVNEGDSLTGTYTYDPCTKDTNLDRSVGIYRHSRVPYGIFLTVGGFVFQTDPDKVVFDIQVTNKSQDIYLLRSFNNLPLDNGASVDFIFWQLEDPSGTALNSDDLPSTAPDLGVWQSANGIIIKGSDPNDPCSPGYFIRADVNSLSLPTRIISLSGNLAFGNVQVGQTAQRTLTIANNGNSELTVSGISYPPGFSGAWSGSVPASGSQNVTVTFKPPAAMKYDGTVTVNSNATSGTNTISASGIGKAGILYVDAKATGKNDGSSWKDAYNHLQDALADANSGTSIRVAQGIYYPDTNSVDPNGSGDREATFQLKSGVSISGGYIGNHNTDSCMMTRVDPNKWEMNLNCCCECQSDCDREGCPCCQQDCMGETILSGDINEPDITADNSYHVVTGSGTLATAVLENVTITLGNADGNAPDDNGGGMLNDQGNPTVRYCCFVENIAADAGGAMYNSNFSSPTLTSNTFCSNTATWGAGLANYFFSSPELHNCVFRDNNATQTGGGVSNTVLSNPEIVNCTFYANYACSFGGGIYCNGSDPNVYNSIMWANGALEGPQIALVANNRRTHIAYCDLQGGKPGVYRDNATVVWNGPIMARDPNFVNQNNCNLRLRTTSACLDASNNSLIGADILSDRDGHPRFAKVPAANPPAGFGVGAQWIADLGAYERPSVIYVGPGGPNDPNGTSWRNSYMFLQDALAKAQPGDQIWVAKGTYTPDRFTDFPNLQYHPEQTFKLENDVGLYGGFDGNETDITDRACACDPCACECERTILSGDLLGNDNYDTPFDSNFFENSWNIVTGVNDINSTAILDGFTIKGGYANGTSPFTPWNKGGGMHNLGSPTIRSCCFEYNWAYDKGGAMYNLEGSPTLTDCEFKDNFTRQDGAGICNIGGSPTLICCTFTRNSGGYGGGMYNEGYLLTPSVTLVKCTFTDNNSVHEKGGAMWNGFIDLLLCDCNFVSNEADKAGGAMYNLDCPGMRLFQCRFSANKAEGDGGAMYNESDDDMQLTNCAFLDNMAANSLGGGMSNWGCLDSNLINCTFKGNRADEGGAIYNGWSLSYYFNGPLTISNSILWDDTAPDGPEISLEECELYINDSILQGGEPNIFVWGNVSIHEDNLLVTDPCFADAEGRLRFDSPAIDAGNNDAVPPCATTDLDGHTRIMDGDYDGIPIVDMGAYEYHIDCDGCVNLQDFAAFAAHWQETGCSNENNWGDRADLDMSGTVDDLDLCMFLRNWLVGTAP